MQTNKQNTKSNGENEKRIKKCAQMSNKKFGDVCKNNRATNERCSWKHLVSSVKWNINNQSNKTICPKQTNQYNNCTV